MKRRLSRWDRGPANVNVGNETVVVDLQAVMVFSAAVLLGGRSAAYPTKVIVPAGFGRVGAAR
jgi:hypothetical protein